MHVRWMIQRDMNRVVSIEQSANKKDPTSEEGFLTVLRQRNCIGMVAEEQGENPRVKGFMIYELHKTHLNVVSFAAENNETAVLDAMVGKLLSKLSSHRRTRISILLRETDMEGLVFFRSRGFFGWPRRDAFEDEDGVLMEHRLQVSEEVEANKIEEEAPF